MVNTRVDDGFLVYHGVGDGIGETEAYASTLTGADKAVLRAGIKRIFPVDEFRMKDHVTLLRALGPQVSQSFPPDEVFGPGDAALCDCCRLVGGRGIGVPAFRTDKPIDPAVFVIGKPDIVDIGFGTAGTRHMDG